MTDKNKVLEMWNENYTGTQIANALGTTRSAVMGILHRLRNKGLIKHRPRPTAEERKKQKVKGVTVAPVLTATPAVKPPPEPASPRLPANVVRGPWRAPDPEPPMQEIELKPEVAPDTQRTGVTLLELKARDCRYVTHVGTGVSTIYCGAPIKRGAYCAAHGLLCYVEPKDHKRKGFFSW